MSGLVHVYCGDGKGKTTAAVGLCARAVGAGKRVVLVQFLKGGETGELAPLQALGVRVLRGKGGTRFSFAMTDAEKAAARAVHDAHLQEAAQLTLAEGVDLLVLDEALGALRHGLLDEELLQGLVRQRPAGLELVLTGRNPPAWLLEAADYVSEFTKQKHPYEKGVPARRGIEL